MLKDGMQPVNWNFISPKVQTHRHCSVFGCFNESEYMKLTKNAKGKYYRIYCKEHATEG